MTSAKSPIKKETNSSVEVNSTNINEETSSDEECFQNFGIDKRSPRTKLEEDELDHDQPAKSTEHIDAVISLLIYHTYSRKHQSKSIRRFRTRDEIDRFDVLYSCLLHHHKTSSLNHVLRNRFLTLKNIKKFQIFEQNEYSRLSEEKKSYLNRVPFIPNLSSYQRRCPYYNLKEMKWIRDHLC